MSELKHHGIRGQRWGKRNGPPYPLEPGDHSAAEKQAKTSTNRKPSNKSERTRGSSSSKAGTKDDATDGKKRILSDRQRTMLKYGAALAVTALAAYGVYKVSKGNPSFKNVFAEKPNLLKLKVPHSLIDKKWTKGLTANEHDALKTYSASTYGDINTSLRLSKLSGKFAYDPPKLKSLVKNMDSAIEKYELKEEKTFVRFSSPRMLGGASTEAEIKKLIGSVVHDNSYTSSTYGGPAVGNIFGHGNSIKYQIKTPPGRGIGAYIENISQSPNEKEFLFGRGSDFKITDVHTVDGRVVVDLLYMGARKGMLSWIGV